MLGLKLWRDSFQESHDGIVEKTMTGIANILSHTVYFCSSAVGGLNSFTKKVDTNRSWHTSGCGSCSHPQLWIPAPLRSAWLSALDLHAVQLSDLCLKQSFSAVSKWAATSGVFDLSFGVFGRFSDRRLSILCRECWPLSRAAGVWKAPMPLHDPLVNQPLAFRSK